MPVPMPVNANVSASIGNASVCMNIILIQLYRVEAAAWNPVPDQRNLSPAPSVSVSVSGRMSDSTSAWASGTSARMSVGMSVGMGFGSLSFISNVLSSKSYSTRDQIPVYW